LLNGKEPVKLEFRTNLYSAIKSEDSEVQASVEINDSFFTYFILFCYLTVFEDAVRLLLVH